MKRKVMLVGLDGAPWSLLNKWILEDLLPTFRRISDAGFRGVLRSTIPSTTFPAVPSLLTGLNPGNLGIFSFLKSDGSPLTLKDVKQDKIWDILGRQGQNSCIVNIPLSYPPEEINGVMISGWSPSDEEIYVYPRELQEVAEGFHDSKAQSELFKLRDRKGNEEDREKLVKKLVEIIEKRYHIFRKLNMEGGYDLSLLWIYQTDFLQHCCWEYQEILLKLYKKIDRILEDAMSNFGDRNLLILSDHGFDSSPSRSFHVNTWLSGEGYLKKRWSPMGHIVNLAQSIAYNYLPRRLVVKLIGKWQTMKAGEDSDSEISVVRFDNIPGIDRENSQAYMSTMFGIKMRQGPSYGSVRDEIIEKLTEVKDEKGETVVRDAWKKEQVYRGKYLDEIPDIVFLTSPNYVPFPALSRSLFGDINRRGYWWQSGEHLRSRDGVVLGCGDSIIKGGSSITADIEDVLPTILHILGCTIPKHLDGRVIREIVTLDEEPKYSDDHGEETPTHKEKYELKKEEEEKILERLRNLGYIE